MSHLSYFLIAAMPGIVAILIEWRATVNQRRHYERLFAQSQWGSWGE